MTVRKPTMRLWVYAVRRGLLLLPTIFGVITILFVFVSALPLQVRLVEASGGGPPSHFLETSGCPESLPTTPCPNPTYAEVVREWGLDRPVYVQWALFTWNMLTLHWGMVNPHGQAAGEYGIDRPTSISTLIGWYAPYSIELLGLGLAISIGAALAIGRRLFGLHAAGAPPWVRAVAYTAPSLPAFLLTSFAAVAALTFVGGAAPMCGGAATRYFDWYGSWPPMPGCVPTPPWIGTNLQTTPTGFPTLDALIGGNGYLAWESVRRMILPGVLLGVVGIGAALRPFVRRLRHGDDEPSTPNSSPTCAHVVQAWQAPPTRAIICELATGIGPTFLALVSVLPIVESVFGLQGVGALVAETAWETGANFGVLLGGTLLLSLLAVSVYFVGDLVRAWLDPQWRAG